jgi:hypothetical protein
VTSESSTPYCKKCGYALTALASTACPECGRAFNLNDPKTYSLTKPSIIRRRIGYALLAIPVGWLSVFVFTFIDPYLYGPPGIRYEMDAVIRLFIVAYVGTGLGIGLSILTFCLMTGYHWIWG